MGKKVGIEKIRFWSSVSFELGDKCWEWKGPFHTDGYGCFNRKINGEWKHFRAHRVVLELLENEVPRELYACHRCDNKKCVRPSHLFLGTAADNMLDMTRKGRRNRIGNKGMTNGRTKLTDKQVLDIRRRYIKGNGSSLGREYGVSPTIISEIVRRISWRHI